MPTQFRIESHLPIPADVLWRVRVSPTFMSHLVSTGALSRMTATPATPLPSRSSTAFRRTQIYVPINLDIPDIVKPVFDDTFLEVSDTQTFDERIPLKQEFSVRPAIMTDLVKTEGTLELIDLGDGSCNHVLEGECDVMVPVLGWYVEQAVVANMNTFYKKYGTYVNMFKESLMQKFGGEGVTLNEAVEKMLADDEKHVIEQQQTSSAETKVDAEKESVRA